jgi:formylglycine-generating enzyme required for sulfatase activity
MPLFFQCFNKKNNLYISVLFCFCFALLLLSFPLLAFEKNKSSEQQLSSALVKKLITNMAWVNGGSFDMGSNSPQARKREKPVHKVSLDGFYMAKYELTQDIFEDVMGWNYSYFSCDNCPVNNVSWVNVQLFIKRLNLALSTTGKKFSLPTEAQWAYAAKGGNKSKNFIYSGSNNIDDVAWYADNAKRKSHPVGLKQPNELGLYDMTGNVWEYCLDNMSLSAYSQTKSHNPFYGSPYDPQQKKKTLIVMRGSGYEFLANESQVFMRDGATNNVRMADIGFRLVMTDNNNEQSK